MAIIRTFSELTANIKLLEQQTLLNLYIQYTAQLHRVPIVTTASQE